MKTLDDLLKSVESWKLNYQKMTDDLPFVNHIYEAAKIQKVITQAIPPNLDILKQNSLITSFNRSIDYFDKNNTNGMLSESYLPASGSTFASADLVTTLVILEDVSINDRENSKWANKNIFEINKIFNISILQDSIKNQIGLIRPSLEDEFISSIKEYEKIKLNIANQIGFGISLRNVLEHFQGNIFEKALSIYKKNKTHKQAFKDWTDVATVLTKTGINTFEYNQLIIEGSNNKSLREKLTKVAKSLDVLTDIEIDTNYRVFLNHLKNTLDLLDLTKL